MRIGGRLARGLAVGGAALGLVAISAAAMPFVQNWWKPASEPVPNATQSTPSHAKDPNTLTLTPETEKAMGIQVAEAEEVTDKQPLEMFGQLAPDIDRLFRVRTRFSGHVAEIGQAPDNTRTLQVGDHVARGQLLAVIWSRDLGDKKSDFVDGLSQLRADETYLKGLEEANARSGSIPEATLLQQRRRVQADRIALERAERTLRSWDMSDAVIKSLEAEAERLRQAREKGGKIDKDQYKQWARYEVRAPFDGTIVEKNISLGEYVDPQATPLPLFQVADYSRLSVFAYPYEEDLRLLQRLPKPIRWTVRVKSDSQFRPFHGAIDILPTIEASQKTLILRGHIDNPDGRLLAGLSVTATIELPPPPDEVKIKASALVDNGREAIVFVQSDPGQHQYVLRRVSVMRRQRDWVYVRSKLSDNAEPSKPGDDHAREPSPLKPGDRVVISGAVLMKAALEDQQGETPSGK